MNDHDQHLATFKKLAERELGAFLSAVTESYGFEHASISAEDWLSEFASMDSLREFTGNELRMVTIRAAVRLSTRVKLVGRRQAATVEFCSNDNV